MSDMIHLEAAERVIGALLKIAAEDTARIIGLEAEIAELHKRIRDDSLIWCAPPDWEAQKVRVDSLLELCDEMERAGKDVKLGSHEIDICIDEIRERLKP